MTLLHEPSDCGFIRRLVQIYREKRNPAQVKEYPRFGPQRYQDTPQLVYRRMSRRTAFQIAWHQAQNARHRV